MSTPLNVESLMRALYVDGAALAARYGLEPPDLESYRAHATAIMDDLDRYTRPAARAIWDDIDRTLAAYLTRS